MLLPAGGARDALVGRTLPAGLLESAAEVLEVLAAPIGEARGVHQRLHQVFGPDQLPPPDVLGRSARLDACLDLRLDIAAYGAGTLSVLSTRA